MDIARPDVARARRIKRILFTAGFVLLVVVITFALSQLEPAVPSVAANTIFMDTVRRGEMLLQVRGMGTLVPEEIRWIPAAAQGVVERIVLQPGAEVRPDSVILILSNPELERQVLDAELQLKAAEAQLENLKVQLESQLLTQRSAAASIQAEYHQAKMRAEVDEQLAKEGLISELTWKQSRVRADELAVRHELEQKRLVIATRAVESQLEAQRAAVEQQRALYLQRKRELDQLRVRPGMRGVLQQVAVEVGQQVSPGTNLARVADPFRLKAEIRIPETQAKDVALGQKAMIDTRNGLSPVASRALTRQSVKARYWWM